MTQILLSNSLLNILDVPKGSQIKQVQTSKLILYIICLPQPAPPPPKKKPALRPVILSVNEHHPLRCPNQKPGNSVIPASCFSWSQSPSPGDSTLHFLCSFCCLMDHVLIISSPHCSEWKSQSHVQLFAALQTPLSMGFSRQSSQPRDWTWVSCVAGRFFTIWATREALPILQTVT